MPEACRVISNRAHGIIILFGIWGGATALGATVLLLPLGIGLAEMKEDRRSQR
ncbi:MAG TPA: hypothetical protein VJP78_10410 [Thermoleophilia bacterium]|nr:hypothetical protein [Thermoleophilia bacterium]